MSNLKLPNLSYDSLASLRGGKLAYATELRRRIEDGVIGYVISHHGNEIAHILPNGVVAITNCGYASITTAARLHKVLTDNDINFRVNARPSRYEMYATEIIPEGLPTAPSVVPVDSSAVWFVPNDQRTLWTAHSSVDIYGKPAALYDWESDN